MASYTQKILNTIGARQPVSRVDNTIKIKSLKEKWILSQFVAAVVEARHHGYDQIKIDLNSLRSEIAFPNLVVPMTAFTDHLSHEQGVDFIVDGAPSVVQKGIFAPLDVSQIRNERNPLNKVWRFRDAHDVFALVTELIDYISGIELFDQPGVIKGIEWSLNEVVDNVIQHADVEAGYIMAQLHGGTEKQIVFCIADAGRGIYASLRSGGVYQPTDSYDAITLALQKGVTRTSGHQGNGLWGLSRILENNRGSLTISTSNARIYINGAGEILKEKATWLNRSKGGTIVDFQFHYDNPIQLTQALDGHEPDSLQYLVNLDSRGEKVRHHLAGNRLGYGTRPAGLFARNEILNSLKQTGLPVIVDFDGIGVVSSSFADECIGKIFSEMGPIQFMASITLENMNDTVKVIVNRAMEQRLHQDTIAKYAPTLIDLDEDDQELPDSR